MRYKVQSIKVWPAQGVDTADGEGASLEQGAEAAGELRPGGVIAYWSATSDPEFAKRLRDTGDEICEERVHAHGKKGTRHTIWMVKTENLENSSSQGA